MSDWISHFLTPAVYDVLKAFLGAGFALLVVEPIRSRCYDKKYGGWRVLVKRDGEPVIERRIGTNRAMAIQADDSELSVFLKGVVSPFGYIKTDLITKGREIGLLTIDSKTRRYVIDLDKNPTGEEAADVR